MNGILALQGGGPFAANDDLDRRLIANAGATRVIVLPTADAYEHPERLVDAAMNWAERLGIEVKALMVMRRGEAMDDAAAAVVRGARAVYLVGDQPLHLRSVLKDTPLWAAITHVLADGGVVCRVADDCDEPHKHLAADQRIGKRNRSTLSNLAPQEASSWRAFGASQ